MKLLSMAVPLGTCVMSLSLLAVSVANAQIQLAPAQQFPCGTGSDVFTDDFDGDGDVDALVVNAHTVSLVPNTGAGAFGPRIVFFASPLGIRCSTSADLDGNGSTDIAVGSSDNIGSGAREIAILLNDGNGGFLPPVSYPFPNANAQQPRFMAAGDLNGDQAADLAVSTAHNDTILIYLNDGSGGFFLAQTIASLDSYGLVIADLDGDTDLDIAAARENHAAQILLNTGGGFFTPGQTVLFSNPGGSGPDNILASDLDGDTDLDLVVTRWLVPGAGGIGGSTSVLLNVGNAMFATPVEYQTGIQPRTAMASDLDGDGFPELLASDQLTDSLVVFANSQAGTFSNVATMGVGQGPGGMASADLDGDGDNDVVTVNHQTQDISVLFNLTPVVAPPFTYPGTGDDLSLLTGVDGPATTGPGNFIKVADPGSALTIFTISIGGTFNLAPSFVVADFFPTGAPPASPAGLPAIHFDLGTFVYLVGPTGPIQPVLPAIGIHLVVVVPPGLAGQSAVIQSIVLSTAAGNGLFAASDGHEIQFVP